MIVTVVAYKRPELLERCLESIAKADLKPVDRLIASLDYYSPAMKEEMYKIFSKYRLDLPPGSVMYRVLDVRLGVANHPRFVYNMVKETHRGEWSVCALEEDTIVSPDAFTFADWALRQPGYKFVNLYAARKPLVGGAYDASASYVATLVHEDNELRGGFGWAFSRAFWAELEPQWNGKIRAPYGWDWQLTHLCHRNNWRVLTPEVGRIYNTGRENGAYDTPSNWDVTQKDVVICQASPCDSNYIIVKHNLYGAPVPEWVREEMRS